MFPSASHQLIGGGTRWHGPYSRDNIFGFVLKLIYINGNGLKKALLGYSVTTIQNSLIDLKHNLIQHDERQNEKGKKGVLEKLLTLQNRIYQNIFVSDKIMCDFND
tara:strand:+ start:135 stop:452 length:318 start_codon:yes stop_codon:yes gene_type:complete